MQETLKVTAILVAMLALPTLEIYLQKQNPNINLTI
jgi:hypothetical protein